MDHSYFSITCWIYIAETSLLRSKTIAFCLDEDLKECIARLKEQRMCLVYCRRFDNVLDALAHKMVLESLEQTSIERAIREINPQHVNLAE